jgi:hypothetical protein
MNKNNKEKITITVLALCILMVSEHYEQHWVDDFLRGAGSFGTAWAVVSFTSMISVKCKKKLHSNDNHE